MLVQLPYGREHLEVEVGESRLVKLHRAPPAAPLADPVAALGAALDRPVRFPPLWRALTPDDRVTIVVDEQLPQVGRLLVPLLEHITRANVAPGAITLFCPPSASRQEWLEDLPEAFEDVHVESHDPTDRQRLAYLATTRQGRRLYLGRAAVEADQLVVFGRRGYDPLLGYSGFEGDLYPVLGDEATRKELNAGLSLAAPDEAAWPIRDEAREVAWLMGAPFLVQVIEGAGDTLSHVLAGSLDSGKDGQALLDARWRGQVSQRADTVIAAVAGDPKRHGFVELARALACAARVVEPGGRIVLLTQAEPKLGPGAALLRKAENPAEALTALQEHAPPDVAAAFLWASAVRRASLYLLSGLPEDVADELFAVPLERAGQVQRLLDTREGSVLVIPDANKTMAVVG